MRILWASHLANRGGAQLCLAEAAAGLIAAGHEVHVALPGHGEMEDILGGVGATVWPARYRWWVHSGVPATGRAVPPRELAVRSLKHVASVGVLSRIVRRAAPDLLVTNTIAFPGLALAGAVLRVPHVWYVHEFGATDHDLHFDYGLSFSLGLMERLSRSIICNSNATRRAYAAHIAPEKVHVAYYAVETPEVTSLKPAGAEGEPLELIMVGYLWPGKRQEDAIKAVALLRDRGRPARLTLVGDSKPSYMARLRGLIDQLRLGDLVRFVPETRNPHVYVAAAHMALMCSREEAFGRVTIEAMKLGRPVVAADTGANPELVRPGVTGLLYRQGDVDDLTAKIELLDRDRDLIHSMGQRAREWSRETFTMPRYMAQLEAILGEAVTRGRPDPQVVPQPALVSEQQEPIAPPTPSC